MLVKSQEESQVAPIAERSAFSVEGYCLLINAKLIGFMYEFQNLEVVFKIKDLTKLRNDMGAKVSSADKKELSNDTTSTKS